MSVHSALELEDVGEVRSPAIPSYSFFSSRTGFGWGMVIAMPVLAIALLSAPYAKTTQNPALSNPLANAVAKPCKNTASGSRSAKKKKNGKKNLDDADADTGAACLEVRSTALEIQEYLQAYGREQKWNLIDEHVGEDAWTFSRKLEKEELLRYSKNDANTHRVSWTSGVAFVEIKTLELAEGLVRVQISARFQGYGQNSDRFAPPKEFWPLISNGTLENYLISILEVHFRNLS